MLSWFDWLLDLDLSFEQIWAGHIKFVQLPVMFYVEGASSSLIKTMIAVFQWL